LAEQLILGTAAHDQDALEGFVSHTFESTDALGVAFADGIANEAGVTGEIFWCFDLPLLQLSIDGGLHRIGAGEGTIREVEQVIALGELLRRFDQRGPFAVVLRPLFEIQHDLFEEEEPNDIGEGAVAAVARAFIGNIGLFSGGAENGFVTLETDERPGAGTKEDVVAIFGGGHRVVSTSGVVSGTGDDFHTGEFREAFYLTELGSGELRLGEPFPWDGEMIERGARPIVGFHIEELRGARDSKLIGHLAAQQIIEVVGEKEAVGREVGDRGAICDGLAELEARVVKYIRDTRGGVDRARAAILERLDASLSAVVAISVGRENEAALIVEQHVIATPGVDANGGKLGAAWEQLHGLLQAGLHFGPEGADFPVGVVAEFTIVIGEAMRFGEREFIFRPCAQNDAATGGAEIDGGGVDDFGHGKLEERFLTTNGH